MRWPQVSWRLIATAASVVVVVVLIAILVFLSGPGRQWTLAQVERLLASQGIGFRAKDISYHLFSPGITLAQPELRALAGTSRTEPFLTAARLDVSLGWGVADITVTTPKLTIFMDKAGRSNLPVLPARPGSTSGGSPVTIQHIRLIDGSLSLRNDVDSTSLDLKRWQADATILSVGGYRINFATNEVGSFAYQGRLESIQSLKFVADSPPAPLTIKNFDLVTGSGRLQASGDLQPKLNLSVNSDMDLARVRTLAGLPDAMSGKATAQVKVTGEMSKPSVSGELTAVAAFWRTYGPLDGTLKFAMNDAGDRVAVSELRSNWEGAAISGSADVALTEAAGNSQATLRVAGVDARRVAALLKEKIPVATQVSGTVSAKWRGLDDFTRASGNASLQFTPTRTRAGEIPLKGKLNVTADTKTAKLITEGLDIGTAVAKANVTVNLGSKALAGTIHLEAADAGAVAKQFGQAESPLMKGPVSADATLAGTVASPVASFEAAAQPPDMNVTARGNASRDAVRVDAFEVKTKGTRLAASGTADLTKPGVGLRFDGTLDRTPLSALTTAAEGAVSGTFSVRGTAQQPEANARVSVEALQASGQSLGNAQAEVIYNAAGLAVPRLQLTKGNGSIVASISGQYRGTAEITNYPLDGPQVSGIVNGKGNFDGASLETGTGSLSLTVTDLAAAGRKPGNLELTATLAQGAVKLNAAVPAWGINTTAEASVRTPYAATAQTTLRDFALENLTALTGTVTGTVNASGNLANPETLRADAEVTSLKVKDGKEEASNSGPIKAHYAAGVVDIESATITSGDSRISAHGQVPVQRGEAALTFDADLDVALAARLAKLDPSLDPAGRLRAKGTLTGSAPNWKPDGTVELSGGKLTVPGLIAPVTAIQASLSLSQGIVKISEATAALLGGTVRVSGEAPLNATEYRLLAEANGLHLEQIRSGSPVAGVVNLRAEAQGKGLTVRGITAKLEAPGLKLQMGELELAAKATPTITVRDGFLRVENFELAGTGTQFQIRGGAALVEPYPLTLRVDGDLDAALAGLFTDAVSAQGRTKLQVAVTGTAKSPRFGGSVELVNVQATIPAANAVIENFSARADLQGQQITISSGSGSLNGGTLTAKGTAELKNGALANVALDLQSRNSAWNIPDGLDTATNIDLRLEGTGPQLTLSGDVRILEGAYRERLIIERGILNSLQQSATSTTGAQQRLPVNLNVRLRTISPIIVSNDLLNGAIRADLRFRGTLQRPGLTGRLDLEEGGTIYLGGRNYLTERASATFTNERRIEPVLDVLARTKAGGREITLEARGVVGNKLETHFTSDDGLSEPDVLALLVTGRTLRETRGAEVDIAGDQALSYLAGSVGGTISQSYNRALGFNLVRIDPSLIAQEAEPTARLTLGQDITDKAGLVYSVNLKNSSDQIWIGRYDVTKRFSARVVRQSDASIRFQFQHDLEFGGEKPPARRRRAAADLRVGQVTITGKTPIPEAELKKRLGLKTGKDYDFFRLRKGMERVKDAFTKKGYPEATVRSDRKPPVDNKVDITLAVEAGDPVQFVYEGSDVPGSVRRKVEKAWSQNSFDSLRSRQAKTVLQQHFAGDGYYEATVDPAVQENTRGGKRVLFEIARGTKQGHLEFAFPGASKENRVALKDLFRDKKDRLEAVLKPERARDKVAEYYRSKGYLEADAKPRVFEKPKPGTLQLTLPVTEGTRYKVGKVEVAGGSQIAPPVVSGQPYVPAEADRGAERIEEQLEEKGYTRAETAVEVAQHPDAKTVDLTYRVTPGEKQVVGKVEVEGNRYTSANLIRTQLGLKTGEPVSSQKLSQARRNLYDTGAFAFTDLELQPGAVGTQVLAKVREVRPYELRYGGLYDTENGPGGILDFSARNVLGGARLIGFRGRYDGQLHEGRAYFEQPNLLRFPMKWVSTGFVRRELTPTFLTDRTGGSTTAEFRWKKSYRFNAGYRFEQVHTFEREPDPVFPFDIRLRIAPLTFGLQRDTRNDILDPRKGSYFSHIAEWAPATLGTQLRYAKYFGQYFIYRPYFGERRFPDAAPRPGLVFAASARFGIAKGLGGQELVPSERFYSGGATSVRGFAQDTLGAAVGETPLGGEGIWIANGEARIPLFKYVDIVGFIDMGNVFRRWQNISFADMRYTGGMGLRIRTPYIMIRFDYGIKLNRRPGDSFGRLYGGIGQAF